MTSPSSLTLLMRDAQGHYTPASPQQILAAARNVIEQHYPAGTVFNTPADIKTYLQTKLAGLEHEVFAVMFFDMGLALIDYVELFRGTIDRTEVYLREVVKEALRRNAAAVVFAHPHPSGQAASSLADQRLTQDLKVALALIDVRVLDHIIVAGNTSMSMAESGLL